MKQLDWDSDFFSRNVYTYDFDSESNFEKDIKLIKKDSLIYVKSLEKINTLKSNLVDQKVTYELIVDGAVDYSPTWACEIVDNYDKNISDDLEDLAIISSKQSRFRVDEEINNILVDKMYKTWINKIQKDDNSVVVVALDESSKVMGMVTIKDLQDSYSIELVGVFPESHRLGVARAMMQKSVLLASEKKIKKMSVVTQADNEAACGLYESLGFKKVDCKYIYHIHKVG